MRHRPAPSAARRAISLCRTAPRTSKRFATLAQAINKTRPTAPSKVKSDKRVPPTKLSCNDSTRTRFPVFVSGYSCSRRAAIAFNSLSACTMETAGLRRATTPTPGSRPRSLNRSAESPIGTKTSATVLNWKFAGVTPTTVKLWLLSVIGLPKTLSSAPNLRCQNP